MGKGRGGEEEGYENRKGAKHFVPHLALAAFELQSLLLSDPRGKGDFHGDVDAVRAANELNPHSRIYNGGPAVARRTIRWSSSDTAIAKVDSVTGVLAGLDRGTVTISARSDTLVGSAKRVIVIKYRSITSGSDHGCNLASGGIAWCWGRNGRQGMIGLDRLDEKEVSTVPVRIRGNHRFVSLTMYGA